MMNAPISAYRLKVERAKRHIGELADEIAAFWRTNPYVVAHEDDSNADKRHFIVKVQRNIPPEWSAIVGDAIHNARAALDLLMVAVVKHCDPSRASFKHVHFVIRESQKEFEDALPKNIKGASPAAQLLVENLKPYKGGDEAFWRLHQLDILDKHKAIIPVGSSFSAFGITFDPAKIFAAFPEAAKGNPMTLFFKPKTRIYPLRDGTHIASTSLNFAGKDDHKFTFDVAFGDGQILDGEPVIPALMQIIQFVESVIDVLETGLPGLKV